MRGKISQWKDDRGFGFINSEDGKERIFFHISAVTTKGRRPKIGDVVLFESMRDAQGRLKANAVVIEGVVDAPKTCSERRIQTEPPKKDALDYLCIALVIGSLVGAVYSFFQTESIENTILFGVMLSVAVVLLNRQKKPKEKIFTCACCNQRSEHDKRTIRGWNNGFLKLYCNVCHRKWLAEQPKETQQVPVSRRGGGCVGISALLVVLPIIAGTAVYKWVV